MSIKKIVTAVLLTSSVSFAAGCWDLKEKSNLEFDELNEVITFSVKDAVSCKIVKGAKVNFGGVALTTNKKGQFSVPLSVLNDGQKIKMLVKATDYIPLLKKLEVEVGTIRGNKILLSPKLAPSSVRFVLSWTDKPKDMDIHLVNDDFHISFRNTKSIAGRAKLDRDAMRGFGPETITLEEVNENSTYSLYVDRYSSRGKIDGNVEVQVYIDNRLNKVVKLPKTSSRSVKVMTLSHGEVKYMNTPLDAIP